jgi:mono/diheme cytochrome c family protein
MAARLLGFVVVTAIVFFAFSWRRALAPVDPTSATTFPADVVARGEVLAGVGDCAACHTVVGGQPYAGGLGLHSGFGTIYSTNITPDPDTGIGRWSEAAFARALHEGIARDGSHLFPAFPYDHYTKVRDEDVHALYAFFMTREPVRTERTPNTLPFPLNVRALQAGWKLLFFRDGVFQPDPAKGDDWNRGAYLAEGLGHCAACHTPRNRLGAEKSDASYAGATVDGWLAPALTSANPAPMPWTRDELSGYLRTGGTALHGSAAGPMSPVVHQGLAKLPDADVRAIATYFADRNGSESRTGDAEQTLATAMALAHRDARNDTADGADLYVAACASCHYNGTSIPLTARPELALNSALTGPDPANLIHVILDGISRNDGMSVLFMPGFAKSLSDTDIATLAAYLRRTRTNQPAWKDLPATVAEIRGHQSAP